MRLASKGKPMGFFTKNPKGGAGGVIGIIPVLVAGFFFQDYFVKGLTMGAVKR